MGNYVMAIEYYQDNGQTLSATLTLQRQQPGGSRLGGSLRYPHTIILWLTCEQKILNDRLNRRIDSMLAQGLLEELRKFHNEFCPDLGGQDETAFTKGILQTIGYKEFIPYVQNFDARNDKEIETYLKGNQYKFPDTENRDLMHVIPTGLNVLSECLNQLKLVTQRYSRRQIKWIKNRFLIEDRQAPDVFELDTSDEQLWQEKVYKPAVAIIEAYRNNETLSEIKPIPKSWHVSATFNTEVSNYCSICQRQFIGEFQWSLHLKSNKHKRRKESRRRNESKHLRQSNSANSFPVAKLDDKDL